MAHPSTGSSTDSAAVPATIQSQPPQVAAADPVQPDPTPAPKSNRRQKNFAPKKAFPEASSHGSVGVSQMLSGVATLPFGDIKFTSPTFKVPCFMMFYHVLSLMDTQMITTKRFTDANQDWMPFVSQLYFGVLVYYFTLTCQKVGATISQDQTLFLEFIEQQYPSIMNAKIPGPLVPFFQSLAANCGPTDAYGNVVFGLPNNMVVTQAQHFLLNNRLNAHLPSLIFILDQMCRYIQHFAPVVVGAAAPIASNMSFADYFYFNVFGTAAAAGAANAVTMLTVSARNEIPMTANIASSFLGASNIWRNCLPFDPATNQSTYQAGPNLNPLSFAQILGFRGVGPTANTTFDWFRQVGRVMQPYADFFRDSVSLGSISTSGIGVNYIRTYSPATAAGSAILTAAPAVRDIRYMAAGTSRYICQSIAGLQTYSEHSEEYLDLITEQMGVLTQLDFDWTNVNGAVGTVHAGPLRANAVLGPFDARLMLRQTAWMDVASTLPPIISGYFHSPSANKFQ